jgi:hypothetical protein
MRSDISGREREMNMFVIVEREKDCMQKTHLVHLKEDKEGKTSISYFSLPGLLPGSHILALNLETRTLSLLRDGPMLIIEQQFSANEMAVLVPMLHSFPHYCPYEELLSHIFSSIVTDSSIALCRKRLQEARLCGTWKQELRPMRRTLPSLRNKLHRFNLEISNIRERGCNLTSLTSPSPEQ